MNRSDVFPTFYVTGRLVRHLWHVIRPLLIGAVLLLLLVNVVTNVTAGRTLEKELSRIRAAGAPLTLREAAPPQVPEDQNAAPVYEQAFHRLPRLERDPQVGEQQRWRLARVDEKVLNDFLADDPEKRQAVSLGQVRQALTGTEDALDLARRAAAMPRCRFPVDWEAGASALFPHYSQLRSVTRLLAAHAVVAAQDGQTAEAVSDLQAIMGMARHIGSEPVLIGQLVQYACLAMAHNSLQQVMESAALSEAESRRLDQALAGIDLYRPFEGAVHTERTFGLWAFGVARGDPAKLKELTGETPFPMVLRVWAGSRLLGDPLLKLDEIFYLRTMARQVALAKEHRRVTGVDADEGTYPWYAQLTRLLLPAFSNAANKRDEAIARLALARCALALHQSHLQTGRYPSSLRDAERPYGQKLPDDPFTGEALIYRPDGRGYRLYSLGVNGRDDQGQPRSRNGSPGGSAQETDDIPWVVDA